MYLIRVSRSLPRYAARVATAVLMAVLLAVADDDELERLILAHSPKFQRILDKSRRQIAETGGIPHDDFWGEVHAGRGEAAPNGERPKRRGRRSK